MTDHHRVLILPARLPRIVFGIEPATIGRNFQILGQLPFLPASTVQRAAGGRVMAGKALDKDRVRAGYAQVIAGQRQVGHIRAE